MKNDGRLTYYMRWVAGITAILIGYGSAKLSVAGIGLGGDLWWLNWVIATALFVAEFMVSGKHEELNWMILAVGAGAYAYSITTNIVGLDRYMIASGNISSDMMNKVTMYAGGFFLDIYPELVLRWALGESKVGDLLGNIVKTFKNPEMLTKSFTTTAPNINVTHRQDKPADRESRHTMYRQPANERKAGGYSQDKRPDPTFHPVNFRATREDDDTENED